MSQMRIVLGITLFATLTACSINQYDPTVNWSAKELFDGAKSAMDKGSYEKAADYQTKLLARYPTSPLAQQALLDLGYAYTKNGDSNKAEAVYDTFIRTYPSSNSADYAYYMKGVVSYKRNQTIFSRLSPSNLAQTDPDRLRRAFNQFAELIKRYPNSRYAEDAKYRMLYLRNLIAQHELEVADHYLRRDAYIAAVNRAKDVLTQYNGTPSVPFALAMMVRAYKELGQQELSNDSMRVLKMNFADKINTPEIQHYLTGNIHREAGIWQMLSEQPKIK